MGGCQSAEQDIASLEVEVKTLNDRVTTCKSQLYDYSETSAQIQAELIENIHELEKVNEQLESGKKGLEDKLNVMNENQRRTSQTLKCGTASCTQLKNEQARLQEYNDLLRTRLLKAEKAEEVLKKLEKDEDACLKKMEKLSKMREDDLKSIQRLASDKKVHMTKINMLNNEIRTLKVGSDKYKNCKTELDKVNLEYTSCVENTEAKIEASEDLSKVKLENLRKKQESLQKQNEDTTLKLQRARLKQYVDMKRMR